MTGKIPTLLVVHDDHAFSTLTANIATQCGYETRIIGNSREFSRAYREALPAVIFMELFMPDFDGIEMINWLVAEKSRSRVILTAKKSPEIAIPAVLIAKASKLFTVTILARPVSVEEIQGALQAALRPA